MAKKIVAKPSARSATKPTVPSAMKPVAPKFVKAVIANLDAGVKAEPTPENESAPVAVLPQPAETAPASTELVPAPNGTFLDRMVGQFDLRLDTQGVVDLYTEQLLAALDDEMDREMDAVRQLDRQIVETTNELNQTVVQFKSEDLVADLNHAAEAMRRLFPNVSYSSDDPILHAGETTSIRFTFSIVCGSPYGDRLTGTRDIPVGRTIRGLLDQLSELRRAHSAHLAVAAQIRSKKNPDAIRRQASANITAYAMNRSADGSDLMAHLSKVASNQVSEVLSRARKAHGIETA